MEFSKLYRVAIYIRVSTQEQALEGYSLDEQASRLEKYAEAHGWTVVKIYTDPGYSGGNTDRPALASLIKAVKANRIDKVIVYKLDRLSRSQKDTLYLIEDVFLANNVDFVSMTENFDTGTPLGRAMIGILSVFAQLEREQIKERMQVGLDGRAKNGYYHGGPYAPIGYNYNDGELIVNEYEAMQIKKIYEMYLDGMPINAIHQYISAHYTNQYGQWTNSAVRSVLSQVVIIGKISWKGEIYEGRHEAIIDDETFNLAQKERDRREKLTGRTNPFKRTTLLGGLVWCGRCGARYYCKQNTITRHKSTPADAKPNRYYTCYSRGKSHKSMIRDPLCKNKSYNVKELDTIILDEIRKLAIDPNYIHDIRAAHEDTSDADNRRIVNDRIAQIDKQVAKLIDLYQISGVDFNTINDKIAALTSEKISLEDELDDIEVHTPALNITETRKILTGFNDIIDEADPDKLSRIVHSLIDSIVIDGEDIKIFWKFV